MKKLLVLTLITLMMLSLAVVANAEDSDFVAAITDVAAQSDLPPADHYYEESANVGNGHGNSGVGLVGIVPANQTPEPAPAPAPKPEAEFKANNLDLGALQSNLGIGGNGVIDISDVPVPMSDGLADLFVSINPDTPDPQFGRPLTLKSFVVNPSGAPLSYQWQIDRGFGWENIPDATAAEYTFDYSESISGCAFRLFVNVMAA